MCRANERKIIKITEKPFGQRQSFWPKSLSHFYSVTASTSKERKIFVGFSVTWLFGCLQLKIKLCVWNMPRWWIHTTKMPPIRRRKERIKLRHRVPVEDTLSQKKKTGLTHIYIFFSLVFFARICVPFCCCGKKGQRTGNQHIYLWIYYVLYPNYLNPLREKENQRRSTEITSD